jgi:Type ISP C-terminal specificity domain/N-6 DNA Methylase
VEQRQQLHLHPGVSNTAAESAIRSYLGAVRQLLATQAHTEERSFYPAVNVLLSALGASRSPRLTTIPEPAAREGDFPDVALWEVDSQVLVLPVEVKPPRTTEADLHRLPQASRYARTFGGGRVLLTNLWLFVLAEFRENVTGPTVLARVKLLDSFEELETSTHARADAIDLEQLIAHGAEIRQTIHDAERVAATLAYHAKQMLAAIEEARPAPKRLLRPVAESLKAGLSIDLAEDFFASTIVQTVIYSLFAAWLESPSPDEFHYRQAEELLPLAAIRELFYQILSPDFRQRCDLGPRLDAATRALHWASRDAIARQFDDYAIQYFYEPFLARFDPGLRDALGVWYTPREIARYQIRRVHEELVRDLNIPAGLADPSVLILDPACGTGTYLHEALEFVRNFHLRNGEPAIVAAQQTRTAALDRVIGFDVLPAAVLVAHLNLARYFKGIWTPIPESRRLRVYLANALTGWGVGERLGAMPLAGVEAEVRQALEVKNRERVIVVLGNPPYEGFSAAESASERRLLSDWIEPLWPEFGLRKHRLGDLYVRFWRIAVRRVAELTGEGIVSFITNRKWLYGRSFPTMRRALVANFPRITVDDLHGDVHDTSHPGDGSVFTTATAAGIQRGVAIVTAVRQFGLSQRHVGRDLWGTGDEKRAQLDNYEGESIDDGLSPLRPTVRNRWRLTSGGEREHYNADDYFEFAISGVQPGREDAVLSWDRSSLEARMQSYFDEGVSDRELFSSHPGFAVEQERYNAAAVRRALMPRGYEPDRVLRFLYRPLDLRWIYWETRERLLTEPRSEFVKHFLVPQGSAPPLRQRCLVFSQTARRPGAARPLVSTEVPGFHAVDPNSIAFPRLHVHFLDESKQRALDLFDRTPVGSVAAVEPNISPAWRAAARAVGVTGTDLEVSDTLFFGMVAVSQSPAWLAALPTTFDELPGIPLAADLDDLKSAANLGTLVADLIDPDCDVQGVTVGMIEPSLATIGVPDEDPEPSLEKGHRNRGGEWREDGGGAVFWRDGRAWRNVPSSVWEFSLGGFQVLPKWLSYRHRARGQILTHADLTTFRLLCRRIAKLVALAPTLDEAYGKARATPLEPFTPGAE